MNGIFNPWAARRSYIEAHGSVIDAYVRALGGAMEWVKDRRNYPEALRIAQKHIKFGDMVPNPDQVMETSLKEMIASYGTKIDRGAVKGVNDFLMSQKMITKPLDPEVVVYRNAP
jgi:ABC-type nitrate/sulfonate/bicarbonate transport system substrate-binding protein